jgi:hypothetical protein
MKSARLVVCVSLLLAGLVACGDRGSGRALTVTVDVGHPGATLPDDFLGLSFEASVLGSTRLSPSGSNLPALLHDLGVGHLRFGGNSLDRVAPRVALSDLERLGALTAATGWRVDLGVSLGHPDPSAAAAEAASAARLIGPGLETVEIGNEPDLYAADKTLKPDGYTYDDYRADVKAYRAAIAAAAPNVRLAGPDTAGLDWLPRYARDEGAGLSSLTQHFYPLTRCGGRRPTVADLFSAATRQRQARVIDAAVAAARAAGISVRLNETNSASCGGQDGVSNTLASALWIIDFLLRAGEGGVAGVGVQGGLAACRGYTPLCVPGATESITSSRPGIDPVADASLGASAGDGPLAVQPDFYGLLLVRQLVGGRWLLVTSDRPSPLSHFALAMPDGSFRVVLVNPATTRTDVVIRTGAQRAITRVLRLTGPSLEATSGIRLGGTAEEGGTRVDLAASSAAIVSLSR